MMYVTNGKKKLMKSSEARGAEENYDAEDE